VKRTRWSLLRRPTTRPSAMHHHQAAAMNFTPNSTGAAHFSVDRRAVVQATAYGHGLRDRAARLDNSWP
jgi:predicted xylose isomerase-like sugar epimerase